MATTVPESILFSVHRVPATRPFVWLAKSWDDLLHHRWASLAYGALVAVMGMVIMNYERHPYFIAAMTSGFLLVGPIMTAGICELSYRQDRGEATDFASSLRAVGQRRTALMNFAAVLFTGALLWFILSSVALQGAIGTAAPPLALTVWGDVMAQLSSAQMQAYVLCGAVLAVIVLALSVVTVPMIIEHHVSAATAMRTSLRVAAKDLPAMLVWGALIVLLVGLGFATAMLALVVVFPLLGHATWYAYRDLVA